MSEIPEAAELEQGTLHFDPQGWFHEQPLREEDFAEGGC